MPRVHVEERRGVVVSTSTKFSQGDDPRNVGYGFPSDDGVEVKFYCRLEEFRCIIKLCLDYAINNAFVVTNLDVLFI